MGKVVSHVYKCPDCYRFVNLPSGLGVEFVECSCGSVMYATRVSRQEPDDMDELEDITIHEL